MLSAYGRNMSSHRSTVPASREPIDGESAGPSSVAEAAQIPTTDTAPTRAQKPKLIASYPPRRAE